MLLRATSRRLTHVTRRTISSTRGEGVAGFKVMEVLNAANIMEAGGADVLHMEAGVDGWPTSMWSTSAPPAFHDVRGVEHLHDLEAGDAFSPRG